MYLVATTTQHSELLIWKRWQHQRLARLQSSGNAAATLEGLNLVQPLWTMVWQLLIELNTHVPHEPALYAQVLIQEKRICVHRKTGIRVSVEALFTIAHNQKRPRCPAMRVAKRTAYPYNEIFVSKKKEPTDTSSTAAAQEFSTTLHWARETYMKECIL